MEGSVTIGTCSLCGGPVSVPSMWMSIIPPVPTCGACGAVEAPHGPVIQMQPQRYTFVVTSGTTTKASFDGTR